MIKGNYVWTDDSKTKVVWEPNSEGRFIMGCDPYIRYKWWQRVFIWLGLMRDKSGDSIAIFDKETRMHLPKDYVNMKNVKFPKTPDESFKSSTDENHTD